MVGSKKVVLPTNDLSLNLNESQLCSENLTLFKVRPSLTTSKEGLKTLNIHLETRRILLRLFGVNMIWLTLAKSSGSQLTLNEIGSLSFKLSYQINSIPKIF